MVSQQLLDYIKQQIALGKTQAEIIPALQQAGWNQEDINQAMQSLSPSTIPTPAIATNSPTSLPPVGTLFSESFVLMKKSFAVIVLSGLTLMLGVLITVAVAFAIWFFAFKNAGVFSPTGLIAAIVLAAVVFIAYVIAILWGTTASITALRDADEGIKTKENLKRSWPLIGSFLLVSILSNLVVIGGYILLIIPGIIFMIRYGFSTFVMVNEGKKGRQALAQSKAYVIGRTGKVFGRILLVYLAYFAPYALLQILISQSHNIIINGISAVLLVLLQIFFGVYFLAFYYTLYKQLKATVEPKDPQTFVKNITGWAIWGAAGFLLAIGCAIAAVLFFTNRGATSRDAQRVIDAQRIKVALELYHTAYGYYPENISKLVPGYINPLPSAPQPADGNCTKAQNAYIYNSPQDQKYTFTYCLGSQIQGHSSGLQTINSAQ